MYGMPTSVEQPDGREVDAFHREPGLQRLAGERERQAGGETEEQDDREVSVAEDVGIFGRGQGGESITERKPRAPRATILFALATERNMEKIVKTDAEWKAQLTPEQYEVTRKHGTERAFTGPNHDSKEPGTYTCVCCGLPLFESHHQVRIGHRLAQLLRADLEGKRGREERPQLVHDAHRGAVRALRCPPRPRVRRRTRSPRGCATA